MEKIVVTRHKSLVEYLKKKKLIDNNVKIYSYVRKLDILDKHVIGKLPFFMACHAGKYTEVRLRTPQDLKGKDLTLEQVEFYFVSINTYKITKADF